MKRQKKVLLKGYDSTWKDTSYVLLTVETFMDAQKVESKISKLSKKLDRSGILLKRKNSSLDDLDDTQFDARIAEIDVLEDELSKHTTEIFKTMMGVVKSNFISGAIIKDTETIELKASNVEDFDIEIIKVLSAEALGNTSKKN